MTALAKTLAARKSAAKTLAARTALKGAALAVALLLAPGAALAQDAAAVLQSGQAALAQGAVREAIERYEAFADRGGLHRM